MMFPITADEKVLLDRLGLHYKSLETAMKNAGIARWRIVLPMAIRHLWSPVDEPMAYYYRAVPVRWRA